MISVIILLKEAYLAEEYYDKLEWISERINILIEAFGKAIALADFEVYSI
jgi:hypothetical protein